MPCPACEFEEEFGTPELPFFLDDRLHSCEGETPFSWKTNPIRVERERAAKSSTDLLRWVRLLWDAGHQVAKTRWETKDRFWNAIDALSSTLDRRERPMLDSEKGS